MLYAQTAPNGYTPNFRFRMWAQGANPSADSLNANWKDIDHQIYRRGWTLGNSKIYPTIAGWKTYFREIAGDTAFGGRLVNVAGSLFVRDSIIAGSLKGVGNEITLLSGGNIIPGTVIASKLTESSMGVSFNIEFTATDHNTVTWTAGTLKTAGGGNYSIAAGTTGAMTSQTYIYFNYDASQTALQVTTNWDVVAEKFILICVAKPALNTDEKAFFVPKVGYLGVNGDNIAANSIKANKIAANAVTASHISSIYLQTIQAVVDSLSALSANLGKVTAGQMVIGNTNRIWLNDGLDGALAIGGTIKANAPFQVSATGAATIKSAMTGQRIEIGSNSLKIFNSAGAFTELLGRTVWDVPGFKFDKPFYLYDDSQALDINYPTQYVYFSEVGIIRTDPTSSADWGIGLLGSAGEAAINLGGEKLYRNATGVLKTSANIHIRDVAYTWPSANATGYLKNNGSGVLTWDAGTGSVPAGIIVMWSGSIASIPSGWALCNGTNGTPDLRDRFIVGAGSTYSVAATGGEATHTLTTSEMPSHTHTATVTDPGHTHSYNATPNASGFTQVATGTGTYHASQTTASSTTGITISNGNTGGGAAHENRPPYYALAYIMKL